MINKINLNEVQVPAYLRLDGLANELNKNFETLATAIQSVDAEGVVTVPGPQGDKGDQGPQGLRGEPGSAGVDGKDGANGRDGVDGKEGLPGKDGKDGVNGRDGVPGSTGAQGPKGDTGAAGAQGPQGLKGDTGATGPAGKDGVSITSAVVNSTGNLIITKSDGSIVDAGKVSTTATTTTTTTAPAVGGALNPTASPIATTTTMKGYIAAYCNAGVFLTLDNLKFSVTTTGNRGLCCATVSGTATLNIGATYSCVSGGNGHSTAGPGVTYTTTPSGSWFGYHFPNAGDTSTYLVNDNTNQRVYRVHLQIGPGYSGNFISIERLL